VLAGVADQPAVGDRAQPALLGHDVYTPTLLRASDGRHIDEVPLQTGLYGRGLPGGGLSFCSAGLYLLLANGGTRSGFVAHQPWNTAAAGFTSTSGSGHGLAWDFGVRGYQNHTGGVEIAHPFFSRGATDTALTPARWAQWRPICHSMLWVMWVVVKLTDAVPDVYCGSRAL